MLDFFGGLIDSFLGAKQNKKANKFAREQFAWQQEAAKNQVQWRVADARKAGIHPLAALGIMPTSFSPTAMDSGGGTNFAGMGQSLDRAIGAYMSRGQREKLAQAAAMDAAVQRKRDAVLFDQQVRANEIDMAIGASQLARLKAPGTGPGVDVGAGVVNVNPSRTTSPSVVTRGREAGDIRDYGFASTDQGGLAVVPSFDVHERIEDNWLQQFGWAIRNQIAPAIGGLAPPSTREHPLPPGYTWRWSPLNQQFLPARRTRSGGWVFLTRRARRN